MDRSKIFVGSKYTDDGAMRAVHTVGLNQQEWEMSDNVGLTVQMGTKFNCRCEDGGWFHFEPAALGRTFVSGPGDRNRITIDGDCRVIQLKLPRMEVDRILLEEIGHDGNFDSIRGGHHDIDPVILQLMGRAMMQVGEIREVTIHAIIARMALKSARGKTIRNRGLRPISLQRVRDVVDSDLIGISLDQMAKAAGLSLFHFAREFRWETGLTPWQFVTNRRVWAALRLYGFGAATTDVVRQVGFANASHMGRIFKGEFGVSPKGVRQTLVP